MEYDAKKGTTTVALVCKDGIVLATDRRASAGYQVAHKNARKIHPIHKFLGATGAGAVGDIQNFVSLLRAESNLYFLKNSHYISTKALASLASRILHGNRYFPYLALIVVAGYDEKPSAYALDPFGGMSEDKFISTGSGSQVAYGILEDRYKDDLTVKEGIEIAVRCIKAAIERDLATGDGISLATITKDGYMEFNDREIEAVM